MANLTFDEFQSMAMELYDIGFKIRNPILEYDPVKQNHVEKEGPAIWYYVGPDREGYSTTERYHPKDFYLLAQWQTGGYGFNTTGSGPVHVEEAKDVFTPLTVLLQKICTKVSWSEAFNLFREKGVGELLEKGRYENTVGDGVIEEYQIDYSYQAINLRALYRWLVKNCIVEGESPE
jgi:hypothetical protein